MMKDKGCLFWGCLGCGGLTVVGLIALAIGAFFAKQGFDKIIETYTSPTSAVIQALELSDVQRGEMEEKYEGIRTGLEDHTGLVYTLTADDLNNWIGSESDLSGKFYVYIADDVITADASIPLDEFGIAGRYLNGKVDLEVEYESGNLQVYANHVEVNGEALPESFMEDVLREILANRNANPNVQDGLRNVESIEIKDGKIFITAKAPGTEVEEIEGFDEIEEVVPE